MPRAARGTRPTSDRLRETLFNILAPRVAGCRFADLYAGTGAVGIEAISRGAEHVWFAERAEAALTAIRANLKVLQIARGYHRGGARDRGAAGTAGQGGGEGGAVAAESVESARAGNLLDLVYIDPPWEAEAEYAKTLELLGSVRGRLMLAPGRAGCRGAQQQVAACGAVRRAGADADAEAGRCCVELLCRG